MADDHTLAKLAHLPGLRRGARARGRDPADRGAQKEPGQREGVPPCRPQRTHSHLPQGEASDGR